MAEGMREVRGVPPCLPLLTGVAAQPDRVTDPTGATRVGTRVGTGSPAPGVVGTWWGLCPVCHAVPAGPSQNPRGDTDMPVSVSPESCDPCVPPWLAVTQRDTVTHVLVAAASPESHDPRVSQGLVVSPDILSHVRASSVPGEL